VSNTLDGRITIKHNLYELTRPVLSKPVCSALEKLAGSRTFLSLPLLAKGKVVGGFFASTRQEEISEGYAETMMTFANQAAIAIENARLFEETQQRALEQETLREAALALTTALDRNQVVDRILAQLQQVVPYDSASVQLLRENRMEIVGGRGFPNLSDLLDISFPADGDNPNSEVIRTRAPVIVEDAPAVYEAFRKDPHRQAAIRSWLGVPMLIGEQLVGMIALDKREPAFYTQEHARLAEAFAAQAAVAIENARLFEEEKRRATQLALINEVGEKAASILDSDRLMQEVTRSIQESFNYYNVALLLLDEARGEVVMQAIAGGFAHMVPGEYRQSVDEGIIGLVVRTGRSRMVNDVSKDPHYIKGFLGEVLTKSELCVPTKLGDKVIGALDVQSIRLNDFDQAEVVAMEAVADRLAIGIQNARLYEEMAGLYDVGLAVSSALELDQTLRAIYEQVNRLMSLDTFYIALYDEARRELRFEIFIEEGEWLPKFTTKLDESSLTTWIIQSGKPLFIGDIEKEREGLPVTPSQMGKPGIRSWIGFPLIARDKVVGVISVQSFRPRAFTEGSKRILSAFANQAAIAVENARLYEETKQRAQEMTALHETALDITARLEMQRVLNAIITRACDLLGATGGLVHLYDPAREKLVAVTSHNLERDYTGLTLEVGEGVAGKVFQTGQSLILDDHRTWAGRSPQVEDAFARSMLGVPLRWREQVVGVLDIVDNERMGAFDDQDLGLLTLFANQAAIAIENARLFEEIEERRMYLEGVLEAAPDAIVTLDAHNRIAEWNTGAERLFGYSREEAIGQDLDHLITSPDVFEEAVGFTQVVMGGKDLPPTETVRYRKDGFPVHVIVAGSPILVRDELIGVVAVYTDITQRKRMEETLRAMALVDDLTGLYNRRGFFTLAAQQLKTADRAKSRMLLLFADFDGLKQINDACGHSEGDQALIEVANVLRKKFRESDIIARIGGDEFVVLATETGRAGSDAITARLQENLEAINAKEGRRYKLSLSMGTAQYDPEHPCSIDELLARADRAMYERKRCNDLS
jgi:diguanylate cyclase (GGDEF)-like protein/PAS domain S-box-containing protein